MAAATIFEPERSKERLAWAKTSALIDTIKSNFGDQTADFVRELEYNSGLPPYVNGYTTRYDLSISLIKTKKCDSTTCLFWIKLKKSLYVPKL